MESIDIQSYIERSKPDFKSNHQFDAVKTYVRLHRDKYGIPHVEAGSVWDVFFGQGFVTAQDRLWHMDVDRRRAYGRWSEWVGADGLAQDRMMRRIQIRQSVERDYAACLPETRLIFDAYAAGVNAYLSTLRDLPLEYILLESRPEKWEPWDSMAVFKVRHIFMGVFESKLWCATVLNKLGVERASQVFPTYPPGGRIIIPPGESYSGNYYDPQPVFEELADFISWFQEVDSGSNNWVLHGKLTASGKPLLAGDPHRALDVPNVYYQNHIACPDFDVIGLSFPGIPGFPHFGHNAQVAWCITHATTDYQDLYIEKIKMDNGVTVLDGNIWRNMASEKEIICVKNGEDVELLNYRSKHGPILALDPVSGHALALKYTALDGENHGFDCLLPMLRARDTDEFESSMKDWVDPCNNLLAADVDGDILYLNRGKMPLRRMENAWLPVPGWMSKYEWQGMIPFDELVRSKNPQCGYIVTANNRIADQDYPYYLGMFFAAEHRCTRIGERIKDLEKATLEDMLSIHAESVSRPALTYQELIRKIHLQSKQSMAARDELLAWDGRMDKDMIAPTVFAMFRAELDKMVFRYWLADFAGEMLATEQKASKKHLSQLSDHIADLVEAHDGSRLPQGMTWEALAEQAFETAVHELVDKLGPDMRDWKWENVHYVAPMHLLANRFPQYREVLNPPCKGISGGGETPLAGRYGYGFPFPVLSTSVARYAFDLSDWDNSRWIVPLGASGHVGNPHAIDQMDKWAEVESIPMVYNWALIKAEAESSQQLLPRITA